jgi:adenylyltransferase/sulfurtransferase
MSKQKIDFVIEKQDRYSRLKSIDWWEQPRVQAARVLVAGAGALGNEVLKNLALLGIGHILVVDFDTIETSNLSRSVLFRSGDVGQPKAAVAVRRIQELNPDVEIMAVHGDAVWDIGAGMLSRFDVVIGCLDNIEARVGINRNCWKAGIPWIDGALGVMAGQVRIFAPPESACYECGMTLQDYQELNLRYSCQLLVAEGLLKGLVATTPTSASIIAAMQVQEVLKLIHGLEQMKGIEIEYDGQYHRYRITNLKRRPDCYSHEEGQYGNVKQLPDARASELTVGGLLEIVRSDLGPDAYVLLDREVITALTCPNGHGVDITVRPRHQTGADAVRCPECGQDRSPTFTHKLTPGVLSDLHLSDLGIPSGHIVCGCYGSSFCYYELSGDRLFGRRLGDL